MKEREKGRISGMSLRGMMPADAPTWPVFADPDTESELVELRAKCERYETYLNRCNRIAFEEWHGHWQDDAFWIFDSDGEGVASGQSVVEALEAFETLEGRRPA